MSQLHFANLDLNLLRVFDALLDERSVTRAGDRLGLTQSAVSHALGRLRHVFADPLFTRRAGGIEPTPRALEIGPGLHTALAHLQDALSPPGFDPLTTERRFTLAAGPYACTIVAPPLLERLRRAAPRIELQIDAHGPNLHENLDTGRIDAAIVSLDAQAPRFHFEPLFTEDMVWVGRAEEDGELTEQRVATRRRIVISGLREPLEGEDAGVSAAISRRSAVGAGRPASEVDAPPEIGVTVPDVFSAVVIAGRSDMVALVPRRLAQIASRAGNVTTREPFQPSEPLIIGALFRADRLTQPALAWFAQTLRDVAATL